MGNVASKYEIGYPKSQTKNNVTKRLTLNVLIHV